MTSPRHRPNGPPQRRDEAGAWTPGGHAATGLFSARALFETCLKRPDHEASASRPPVFLLLAARCLLRFLRRLTRNLVRRQACILISLWTRFVRAFALVVAHPCLHLSVQAATPPPRSRPHIAVPHRETVAANEIARRCHASAVDEKGGSDAGGLAERRGLYEIGRPRTRAFVTHTRHRVLLHTGDERRARLLVARLAESGSGSPLRFLCASKSTTLRSHQTT